MAGESDATTIMAARHIRDRVKALRPGNYYDVFAHSQGTAIVDTALGMLTPAERSRVNLTTYGDIVIKYSADLHSVRRVVNPADLIQLALSGASPLHPTPVQANETREYMFFVHDWAHTLAGYLAEEHARSSRPLRVVVQPPASPANWVDEYNRAMAGLPSIPVR